MLSNRRLAYLHYSRFKLSEMNLILVSAIMQQLLMFSNAGTLPHNWRDFIDPDILLESGSDQSRYSPEMWQGDVSSLELGERPANVAANAVDKAELMWPNNTVPYVFTTERSVRFGAVKRTQIAEAMEIIMVLTGHCVKFVERTEETDYIKFQKGYQCFSDIGRTGGKQVVSLSSACVERYGCIQHELMHVLGFFHEQSRQDRDDYITIIWENIAKENKAQFAQHAGNTYGLPYDYESIMQYQFNAFAEDDQFPTILPKGRRAKIGQKENLSPLDVARIHRHLKCGIPSGKNFVVSRPKENQEVQDTRIPVIAGLEPFPIFSAEPMSQEQCAHQFNENCAPSGMTTKNCTSNPGLQIVCDSQATFSQLQDMAMGMSTRPLRAITVHLFDGEQLNFDNFAVIRKQIVSLDMYNCLSNRITAKLPRLQYANLLAFGLRNCYDMQIKRSDFAQSTNLRQVALTNSTIQNLESDTFTDLAGLRLLSLENGYSEMSAFSGHVRDYLKRLHCDCEFSWFRRYWNSNPQLIRKAAQAGEVYNIPYSWRNPAWSKDEIYLPIDCSSTPFPSGAGSIDFMQQRFSINDDTDFGSEVSECMDSEAVDSFPAFSEDPITSEQCALQFSSSCAPDGLTRSNCTAFWRLDINCNRLAGPEEMKLMTTAMAKTPPRPTRIDVYDGTSISSRNFAPVREQVVIFYLRDCKDNRGTSKPDKLRTVNLLDISLVNCYNQNIVKRDFQRITKLRIIVLRNSTVLTLEVGTFTDLPSLGVLSLEYGLTNFGTFSPEIRDYIFRLHCSCDFAWYRRWLNSNTTQKTSYAGAGEIFSLNSAWCNAAYAQEDIYLPVDCLTPPSESDTGDLLQLIRFEFSINENKCPS